MIPRHRAPCAIALAAITALLVSGCGSSASSTTVTSTQTSSASASSGAASSQKTSAGSPASSAPAKQGSIGTDSTPSQAPSAPAKAPGEQLLHRYTGSGGRSVGTIVLHSPTTLVWNAAKPIQVFTSKGFVLVNARTPNGRVLLAKGKYPGVRVASHGSWSVELRAAH